MYKLKPFLKNGLLKGYLGEQKCSPAPQEEVKWSSRAKPVCRELQVISGIAQWIGHGLDLNTLQMPLAENLPDVSSVV